MTAARSAHRAEGFVVDLRRWNAQPFKAIAEISDELCGPADHVMCLWSCAKRKQSFRRDAPLRIVGVLRLVIQAGRRIIEALRYVLRAAHQIRNLLSKGMGISVARAVHKPDRTRRRRIHYPVQDR